MATQIGDITFRSYEPGDEDAIIRSFNIVFREVCGEGYVDRDLAEWRWRFEDNPFGHRIHLAVAADGTIAGHYGAMPVPFVTKFGDATFVQIVDSFTRPEYRRGIARPGLFVEMGRRCVEDLRSRNESWYGYPVKAAMRIGSRYLGYEQIRIVNYLVLNADATAPQPASDVQLERLERVDEEVDALFEEFRKGKDCLLRRCPEYLNWRYADAPGSPYEIWAARRDGKLCGLMVLRPEHELIPGACTIADWVVPVGDDGAIDSLLAKAHEVCRARGRQRVMTIFPEPSPDYAALLARGFEAIPSGEFMERPFTVGNAHPQMDIAWIAENWWYALGDSDLV